MIYLAILAAYIVVGWLTIKFCQRFLGYETRTKSQIPPGIIIMAWPFVWIGIAWCAVLGVLFYAIKRRVR